MALFYEKCILHLPDVIGIIGVFCSLLAYVLLQLRYWTSKDLKFSLVNVFGSACILFSLYFHWNLASFLIEIVWLLLSGYGVIQALRPKENTPLA